MDYRIKRLELWIGLIKFTSGTVVLGLVSLFLNHQYQSNQLELEREKSAHEISLQDKKAEFDYLSKFMVHAMNEDLEVRIRLASYMQAAALSDNIKGIWKRYHDVLVEQQRITFAKREQLRKQKEVMELELASVGEENRKASKDLLQSIEEVRKEIYYLQDQLDRRKYGEFKKTYVDVYELLDEADLASGAGNHQLALSLLLDGLKAADDSTAWVFLARISTTYRALRDFENAELYMGRAVAMRPSAGNLYSQAIMQKNNDKLADAIATLQKAERLASGTLLLNIQLAIAGYLVHQGNRDDGMAKFESIRQQVENNSAVATNLAWFRSVAGPPDEFYRVFEIALKSDPSGRVFEWVDVEVDLDPYRGDERFKALVERYRP